MSAALSPIRPALAGSSNRAACGMRTASLPGRLVEGASREQPLVSAVRHAAQPGAFTYERGRGRGHVIEPKRPIRAIHRMKTALARRPHRRPGPDHQPDPSRSGYAQGTSEVGRVHARTSDGLPARGGLLPGLPPVGGLDLYPLRRVAPTASLTSHATVTSRARHTRTDRLVSPTWRTEVTERSEIRERQRTSGGRSTLPAEKRRPLPGDGPPGRA